MSTPTRPYVFDEIRRLPLAQCPLCKGYRKEPPRWPWTCYHEHVRSYDEVQRRSIVMGHDQEAA